MAASVPHAGTGKSSFVCALCLGLNGSPKVRAVLAAHHELWHATTCVCTGGHVGWSRLPANLQAAHAPTACACMAVWHQSMQGAADHMLAAGGARDICVRRAHAPMPTWGHQAAPAPGPEARKAHWLPLPPVSP